VFPVLDIDPKPIRVLFLESDLQNTGTAIALGRVWKADRSEKRANILTDLSHSYALYSPGSWIGVPAFCKSQIVPGAADVSQDQFPGIPVLAGLCRPYPSLDSRHFGPGRSPWVAPRPGFPAFWSWEVSVGSAQARIPGILVLAGLRG